MKTKNEFVKEIWNTLKSVPLEKREAFLYKIKHDWIESVEKRLDKDLSKNWFCRKCKKYFPLKDLKVEKRTDSSQSCLIL